MKKLLVPAFGGLLGLISSAGAQVVVEGNYSTPAMDRWMYPFNFSAGAETSASVFAALEQVGFDDRDAQFLLGWTTSTQVTPGRPLRGYRLESARVRVYFATGDRWVYDPTFDGVRTSYPVTDPEGLPDIDDGKPVELFPVGYRGGWSLANFQEASPFVNGSPFPPTEGVRNAFAATVDVTGAASDVSRQVEFRFDATPLSVGQVPSVMPGMVVPEGSEMIFDLDVSSAATQAYFGRAFASGRLQLMISTLSPAAGGPGGGTGDATYPAFLTKENALAQPLNAQPKLEFVVKLVDPGDYNADGGVDGDDIIAFFGDWDAGNEAADFNYDGGVDGDDIIGFFAEWDNG